MLLPTDNNKLLMQWKGPYTIKENFGDNNYRGIYYVRGRMKT